MVKEILLRVVRRAMPVHHEWGGVEALYGRLPGARYIPIHAAPDLIDMINDLPFDQYVLDFVLEDGTVKTVTYVLEEVVGAILVHCEDPVPELQLCFGFPTSYECQVWYHDLGRKRLEPSVIFKTTEPGIISPSIRAKVREAGQRLSGEDSKYFTVNTGRFLHRDLLALPEDHDRFRRYISWFGEELVLEAFIDRAKGTFRAEAYDLAGNPREDMGFGFEFVCNVANDRRERGTEIDLSATAPLPQKTKQYPTPRTNKRAHFKK